MEYKNKVIEVIKLVLEGYKNSDDKSKHFLHQNISGKDYYLWDCDYLLGQILRHYDVPWNHYYYSKGFIDLWIKLGMNEDDRRKYHYHEKIICQNDGVKCFLYTGASKTPNNVDDPILKKGDCFPYRDAFHLEHIVPISHIVDMLVKLENPTDEQIENVLDQIHVARITKEEDRRMHNRNKRDSTFEEVYRSLYLKNEIVLIRESDNKEVK